MIEQFCDDPPCRKPAAIRLRLRLLPQLRLHRRRRRLLSMATDRSSTTTTTTTTTTTSMQAHTEPLPSVGCARQKRTKIGWFMTKPLGIKPNTNKGVNSRCPDQNCSSTSEIVENNMKTLISPCVKAETNSVSLKSTKIATTPTKHNIY